MTEPRRQTPEGPMHFQPEWWRVAVASIGDAVITADVNGRITFLNPVAESVTGWTLAEATGVPLESVFRIINEEGRQPVESPTVRALRDGVVVGLANHTLLISKDGTERPIDDSAAPIRNDKGEVAGVVLVFRDVTERRRQEEKVKDALAYAENIIATVRESLIVLDKNLRVQTANRTFYQTFHVSKEDTENASFFDLGDRQWDVPELRALLKVILPRNHSFHDFEVEHDFPLLGKRIMLLNARRFVPMNSMPELILLAIEDVTERRRAEAQVKENELRYRRLFETAKDGILILDAGTGKITDANSFLTELLGYSHAELRGKELWQIGVFQDAEANRAVYRLLHDRGHVRYDHLPLENRSGQPVEVEFVSNVYQVDHRPVIQCNIRDITARRQLERAKAQAEASADLHRRKDEFLAMLSHELRNPLAPIMNAVHLLRLERGGENPIQQQARTIIERQVGQLSHLVNDLLEVSRITTGRVRLHKENVDVRGVLERAVDTVRPLIEQRRHELIVTLPLQPIWLHADPTRIEQVVVNLLNNAAKYTDEGGRVWLSVQQEGDEVVVRVRDTGVGIAPNLLPRIFDLFTQAERSLDRSQGGLGIGLTLVQRLIEIHGGKVEAYSVIGDGSEFVVRLPVLNPPTRQPQTTAAETVEQPSAHALRVLVVDDNVDAADSAAMLLRLSGHEVRVAYSGPTALEVAVEYQPNVVLLDIGLPEMDGYEVARRLRQHPQLKDVRLVAMTGYGQEEDRHRSRAAGFNAHLVKPVAPRKLQEVLSDVLADGPPRPHG